MASAADNSKPSRVQLSLVDGCEQEIPAQPALADVVAAAIEEHGATWPSGLCSDIAKRCGVSTQAVSAARSKQMALAVQPPADPPDQLELSVEPAAPEGPELSEASARMLQKLHASQARHRARLELTAEEAAALKAKRGCDDQRIAGITRIRQASDLPEGFRHWGQHADKLVPCDCIPWSCASGRVEHQLNPDTAPLDENGRPMKYLFRKGCGGLVGVLAGSEQLVLDSDVPLVIVEGTYQGRAVATALEGSSNPYAVVQVSGCDGWMTGGAPSPEFAHIPLRGREVFFLPDADVKTNRGVYDATKYLRENLLDEYLAKDVRIVHLPGRGNDGADDVLSRHDQAHNQEMVLRWLDKARGKDGVLSSKPPRKPRRNSGFFTEQGQFQPVDFWKYLQQKHQLALNGDKAIALYEGGVYLNSDSRRWNKAVEEALGNDFVPQYLNTVGEIAHSSLKVDGREVPTFLQEPLLNVANGLVDLRTGELREHTPEVITTTQLPIHWEPTAKCPTWEALIEGALPGQLQRLEDVMSQALDWTRSPTKILLLYGASRAGKGLILRVLEQLMGRGNYSAVTLHQLADNRFMVAELYGKRANIAGELKPEEVRDISAVKMLTGEDPIQADKKYGSTFTFYSYAFLAFSCNKLPPVNETTKAFTSRVAPFRFTVGYDGREDLTLRGKLTAELPGILVRLVKAWQRRNERGTFLPVDPATRAHFDENIDHVARFLALRTRPVERLADGIKRSDLFPMWKEWCDEQNLTLVGRSTTKPTFYEKVRNNGVQEGKDRNGTVRWWLRQASDDESGDDGDFVGDDGPAELPSTAEPAEDGGNSAVTKPAANTGGSGERRQRRQSTAKTSADKKPTAENDLPVLPKASKVTERYGQGCSNSAVIAVISPAPLELPDWLTYVTSADQLPALDQLAAVLGVDFETFNRRTDYYRACASLFPWLGGRPRIVSLHDGERCWVIDIPAVGQPAVDLLSSLARNPEQTLVGHNLQFECMVLLGLEIRPICRLRCTQLAAQLLRAGRTNHKEWGDCSLAGAALRHLGEEISKDEQTSDWGAEHLTASQLIYNAKDSEVSLRLLPVLEADLDKEGMLHLLDDECRAIPAFAQMNLTGFDFDIAAAKQLQEQMQPQYDALRRDVEAGLGITNYRSHPQLFPALQKLDPQLKNTKGDTLAILATQHQVVVDLLKLRKLENRLNTFLAGLIKMAELTGGKVYPNIKQIGAASGRTSCPAHFKDKVETGEVKLKKDGTPCKNQPKVDISLQSTLQGVPNDDEDGEGNVGDLGAFRPMFKAPEGHKLIDGDWANIQFRLAAYIYGDSAMAKIACNPKTDVHAVMVKQAKGEFVPESLEVGKDEVSGQDRREAKPCTFSQLFGCFPKQLQAKLTAVRGRPAPYEDAMAMYRAFHRTCKDLDRAMQRFDDRELSYTPIRVQHNLAGRKLMTKFGTPFFRTDGINYPVQSCDKEMLIRTLGRLWVEFDATPEIRFAHEAHDEICLVAPDHLAEQASVSLKAAMEADDMRQLFLGDIPLDADVQIGQHWGAVH